MRRMTRMRSGLGKLALAALLGLVLSSSSGCTLLLLGVGGAGGYLIKKGEDGESSTKKAGATKDATKESTAKKSE